MRDNTYYYNAEQKYFFVFILIFSSFIYHNRLKCCNYWRMCNIRIVAYRPKIPFPSFVFSGISTFFLMIFKPLDFVFSISFLNDFNSIFDFRLISIIFKLLDLVPRWEHRWVLRMFNNSDILWFFIVCFHIWHFTSKPATPTILQSQNFYIKLQRMILSIDTICSFTIKVYFFHAYHFLYRIRCVTDFYRVLCFLIRFNSL